MIHAYPRGRRRTWVLSCPAKEISRINDWLVTKWIPATKQAGMNGYFTFRNAFGGNAREWITFSLVDNWAAFDENHPVHQSLGEEKWVELISAAGPMTTAPIRKILRLRPDLGVDTAS